MGFQEDLPQLAPGELGWAIDSRRLFIGNGRVEDGAPPAYTDPNNTEIITEHSIGDLISNFPLYQYEGNGIITPITGPDALNPVFRTIQDRLDDYVSVKAFGAMGDGSTDDTSAINKALNELYVHDYTDYNKKVLFFPAGDYLIGGDLVKIPRNARIQGEGIDCTFITQTDATISAVLYVADSMQQIDAIIGTNGADYPGNNHVSNLTLRHSSLDYDIVKIRSAAGVTFENVKFENIWNTGSGAGSNSQAIDIRNIIGGPITSNIKFNNCEFVGHENVNKLNYDATNIIFNNCKFYMCYRGISIGDNFGPGQIRVAYGYKIVNSFFDKIYETAIKTYAGVHSVTSANNYFYDVGNQNAGISGYNYDIISFADSGNASIADYSERPDIDGLIKQTNLINSGSISLSPNHGIYLNNWQSAPSQTLELVDNNSVPTGTGIVKSYTYNHSLKINYTITRNNNLRFGELQITATSGGLSITDNYEEPSGDVGVVFSIAAISGTDYGIYYTTTNTSNNATLNYQINAMR